MVLLETAVANVVAVKIFDAGGELECWGPITLIAQPLHVVALEAAWRSFGMRVGTMCLYEGASARFERERDWNRTGEVQAQLTVDQTVSTVPARVTGLAK